MGEWAYETDPEFAYQPTDIDDELFLSEVPLNLLQKSIESQFQDPAEYRKRDYIQSYLIKYEFSKNNLEGDELEELYEMRDRFLAFITNIFDVYLGVGFPEIEDMDDDDAHDLILQTYRFFIKNIKKNMVNLIMNYTEQHIEELVNDDELCPKKRDVTTLNFKGEIEDENDVIILSNLGDIIEYVYDQELTVDDFFSLIKSSGNCLETEYVEEKFDEFLITGNFVESYINMIRNDSNFKVEIESKIRNKILKKYPKRTRNKIENEIDEEPAEESSESDSE